MAKISVYYDYINDSISPIWMVITFSRGMIQWDKNKNTLYIPLHAPFKRHFAEDFHSDTMGLSIQIEDIMIHPDKPGYFGLSIPSILSRLNSLKEQELIEFDHIEIEQFIIQMADIEEVLQMNVRGQFKWKTERNENA